jgi:hypothetical protein
MGHNRPPTPIRGTGIGIASVSPTGARHETSAPSIFAPVSAGYSSYRPFGHTVRPRCLVSDRKNDEDCRSVPARRRRRYVCPSAGRTVRSQSKRNVTQSKAFTERLEAAIARYHANALTTAQVLEELIALAKDIRAARSRGEETGLTDEEIAFYDALAENESARQVMGEPTLRVIAQELATVIKGNVSVDWMHRDSAHANIRRHVKRLLRKYGYPPDLQDAAVQNVLQQAEALSADWAA